MFEFLPDVKYIESHPDVTVGTILKQPSWVYPTRGSSDGGLAVRAESLHGFIGYVEKTLNTNPNPSSTKTATRVNIEQGGWQFFRTWDECVATYKERPWEMRTFQANDVHLKFAENAGNDVTFDVTGTFFDIDRVLEGTPECWGTNVMGNPNGLYARIVLNLSASAYFSPEALAQRGRRVTRLVDWLESQGIRTEILALMSSECAHVEIVVKRYEDALNLDSVAVVGHTDFYRRLVFRVMEMSPTWADAHGTSTTIRQGRMTMPPVEAQGIMIFSENQSSVEAVDAAFDRLEKQLETALFEGDRQFSTNL